MCFVPDFSGCLRGVEMAKQHYTGNFQRVKKGANNEQNKKTNKKRNT